MDMVFDFLGWAFIGAGALFSLIGGFGILRLPDLFTRCHGAGMIDTAGMGLILTGCMFTAGLTLVTVKLFFIIVFILLTSPATTHALARAALHGGVVPLTGLASVAALVGDDEGGANGGGDTGEDAPSNT